MHRLRVDPAPPTGASEPAPTLARLDPGPQPPATPLPTVGAIDLYGALLADAKKPTTRRAREQDIADLAGFLGTGNPSRACALLVAGDVGTANAIGTAYVRHLIDRGLAPATINRRISTLRRLATLARRFGLVPWSIDVDSLKARAYRDTAGPGQEGMERLLTAARQGATHPKGRRDWALVALLYTAGLRRAEAEALDRADLDLGGRRVRVLGKGRFETEWLPFGSAAAEALAAWLQSHPDPRPEAPLFVRLDGAAERPDRLTADGMHHVLTTLGRRVGLARPLAPHQLRHAAITRLAERTGGDMPRIQKFSRHARLDTVAVYVDNQRAAASELADLLGEDL